METIFTIADGRPVLLLYSKDTLLLLIRASVQLHQAMMFFQKDCLALPPTPTPDQQCPEPRER